MCMCKQCIQTSMHICTCICMYIYIVTQLNMIPEGVLNVMLRAMLHDILEMPRFAYENGTT